MCKEVILIGGGGHAKVVADIVKSCGDKVIGILDDAVAGSVLDMPVLGKVANCEKYQDKYFVIAIGNNRVRAMLAQRYDFLKYYTAVHPTAVISESAQIGVGTVVMPYAVVQASARIGEHCILNTATVVEHDCVLGDFVHISPHATLCGTVSVGTGTQIGAGATVKNNISICQETVVGAGATVVKNIEVPGVYVGVPAKELK